MFQSGVSSSIQWTGHIVEYVSQEEPVLLMHHNSSRQLQLIKTNNACAEVWVMSNAANQSFVLQQHEEAVKHDHKKQAAHLTRS